MSRPRVTARRRCSGLSSAQEPMCRIGFACIVSFPPSSGQRRCRRSALMTVLSPSSGQPRCRRSALMTLPSQVAGAILARSQARRLLPAHAGVDSSRIRPVHGGQRGKRRRPHNGRQSISALVEGLSQPPTSDALITAIREELVDVIPATPSTAQRSACRTGTKPVTYLQGTGRVMVEKKGIKRDF